MEVIENHDPDHFRQVMNSATSLNEKTSFEKYVNDHFAILFFTAFVQNDQTVNRKVQVGPKNNDMSKTSSIFILKRKDEFPNHYFGLLSLSERISCYSIKLIQIFRLHDINIGPHCC